MGVEPIARAYEARCVTGRTPQCCLMLNKFKPDGSRKPNLKLVEGDGLEPSLPAYQTGFLPLEEPSSLPQATGG